MSQYNGHVLIIFFLNSFTNSFAARTPMVFLASYLVVGITYESDICDDFEALDDRQAALTSKVNSLASICMLDFRFKGFKATDIACAIIYHARMEMQIEPAWCEELTELTSCEPSSEGVLDVLSQLYESITPPIRTPRKQAFALNDSETEETSESSTLIVIDPLETRTPEINKENLQPKYYDASPISIAKMDNITVEEY